MRWKVSEAGLCQQCVNEDKREREGFEWEQSIIYLSPTDFISLFLSNTANAQAGNNSERTSPSTGETVHWHYTTIS